MSRKKVPTVLVPDEMTAQNGLIFKGDRVIIPKGSRQDMREHIHGGYVEEQACLRRAREALYWPGTISEIKRYVSVCEAYRMYEIANRKETLIPNELPERPRER